MAEAFARHRFASRDLDVQVGSSGLLESGRSVPDEIGELMDKRGIDVWNHRSRTQTPELISSASLVIGMERQHVREAVALVPDAFYKTFTLPEFVRRLATAERDVCAEAGTPDPSRIAPPAFGDLDGWLLIVGESRTRRELMGRNAADEVDDPIGRPVRVYERVANEIEGLVDQMIDIIWPGESRVVSEEAAPTRRFLRSSGRKR